MDINIRPVDNTGELKYFYSVINYIQFAIEFIGSGVDYHVYKHEAEVWGKPVISEESYNAQIQDIKDCLADCRKCEQVAIDCLPLIIEAMPLGELDGYPS